MKKGFTLVEIMIVVAIIALLAAIAIPNLLRARLNANDAAAKADLQALVTALESYAAANGVYPTSQDALRNATPPYLNEDMCGKTKHGYTFKCNLSAANYTITATPQSCGTSGTKEYTVKTGNVWTTDDCSSSSSSSS
ncbi:MAG: prepilin-type N-terminal cleavage/methylation domain-containing protein [Candidatus Omnitrophica bacterium]|nr:prepilin-type N-terminal cleavage/methylation domain-containing protein [Candidatus Omnitrophota bacterium]